MISAMRHRSRPAQDDFILCSEGILHHNVDVGKSTANALHKWHKLCRATKRAAIFKFADSDRIGGEKCGLFPFYLRSKLL
jgi:hypothetical protein